MLSASPPLPRSQARTRHYSPTFTQRWVAPRLRVSLLSDARTVTRDATLDSFKSGITRERELRNSTFFISFFYSYVFSKKGSPPGGTMEAGSKNVALLVAEAKTGGSRESDFA